MSYNFIFYLLTFLLFNLSIRNTFTYIVVPFFFGEIALHILTEALGNHWQRNQIFVDGTIMLACPNVILFAAERKVGEPAIGLEQCDWFYLHVVGHPKEQLTVVTGRIETLTVEFHLRNL